MTCLGSGRFVTVRRRDANGYGVCWFCKRLFKVTKDGYLRKHQMLKFGDS